MTNLAGKKFAKVWFDIDQDTIYGTREGYTSEKEDDQTNVGKCGGKVDSLRITGY